MEKIDRRSALAVGLAAASAAVVKPAAAQAPQPLAAGDTAPWPGVVVRSYGETPSLIPGFKTVSMRDMIIQPGSKGNPSGDAMMNAMVCHILEGELRFDQDGRSFTAKRTSSGPATRARKRSPSMTAGRLPSCASPT